MNLYFNLYSLTKILDLGVDGRIVTETGLENVDWIHLARDTDQQRCLIYLLVTYQAKNPTR